ncbi:putative bifunctional diguanylate cyclase/phosphodiesterase [uncultured Sphingomonas sp.]|uniref:putative bifunctional diguanylate cyclase/phosphodiesterase n=1 Tax=uncultured Sphingomonas sp. TaxID=158754 RepID=UPI0035CB9B2E
MEAATLKGRAIIFAMCAGAVAFILAMLATYRGAIDLGNVTLALIPAIVCATLCWAAAERAVATTAAALDSAIARMAQAAQGDLVGPIPPEIEAIVPTLAEAMATLFEQTEANIEGVNRLAMFDPVTDLSNRIHFRRVAERLLAEVPAGSAGALLFIDLDRFKSVNDTLGHATGDIVLGMVASRLRAVADEIAASAGGPSPLIGRLSGDEFVMFFPALPEDRDARRIGQAVVRALAKPFDVSGASAVIGASVGVALLPDHGATLHDLMRAADAAMYVAKASGRGRAEQFSDALATGIADRARLEAELRAGIQCGQFAMVYQPQISLIDGKIVAVEALLRWHHPDQGVMLPATFLQCAEESGVIVELGDWIVSAVAATIRRWDMIGIGQRLAINISQRQLDHASFFVRLRDALRSTGAPARLLELEMTETLAMQFSDDTIAAIEALRSDGVTIAIDNYGSGSSSLSRLCRLPIDRIKLHGGLIEHIVERAEARQIAQSVIGLIHGLGCEAVAKGVENTDQAEVLRVIGCDVIQGYAMARPMGEDDFVAWVQDGRRQARAG